jgi:hypothetical protein
VQGTISGIDVIFGGEQGYLDTRFKHPLFTDEVIVGFQFGHGESGEPETFSPKQASILGKFIEEFPTFKTQFFDQVRANYSSNFSDFFSDEEVAAITPLLELPLPEFEKLFHNPFIKINFEDSIVFGFYDCPFDPEHGCAVEITEGEITEISNAANLT